MVKSLPAMQETWVWSLGQEDALEKGMAPTVVFLPGEFQGQRSLVGYSPQGQKESNTTEWLTHTEEIDMSNNKIQYKDTWRRHWQPTPVLLPGKSHGWRSLVGCSPRGREESETTEWLHSHFSLSCIWRRKWQPTPVFYGWRIPGTGEPGGLPSMGSHRVGHD